MARQSSSSGGSYVAPNQPGTTTQQPSAPDAGNSNGGGTQTSAGYSGVGNFDFGFGSYVDVEVDTAGVTHLLATEPTGEVQYARCAQNCQQQSSWTVTQIATGAEAAMSRIKVLGTTLHILLYAESSGTGAYFYGTCQANCTAAPSWTFAHVATAKKWLGSEYEYFSVSPTGQVAFVYIDKRDQSTDGQYFASCNSDCGTAANWQRSRWDTAATSYDMMSLELMPSGGLLFVYSYDNSLRVEQYKNGTWSAPISFGEADSASVRSNAAGQSFISYVRATDSALRLLVCGGNCGNAASWTDTAVRAGTPELALNEMTLDANGNPVMVTNGGSWAVEVFRFNGSAWAKTVVGTSSEKGPAAVLCASNMWQTVRPVIAAHPAGGFVVPYIATQLHFGGSCSTIGYNTGSTTHLGWTGN